MMDHKLNFPVPSWQTCPHTIHGADQIQEDIEQRILKSLRVIEIVKFVSYDCIYNKHKNDERIFNLQKVKIYLRDGAVRQFGWQFCYKLEIRIPKKIRNTKFQISKSKIRRSYQFGV